MKTQCAPVCQSCDQLSVETRCPIDLKKMPNIWEKGDVNKFFTNLTTSEDFQKYGGKVLSRPDYLPGDTNETAEYKANGPWAVLLENFITDEEADRLIELGAAEGYKRSSDVGKLKADGTYENHIGYGRTSHNSWCQTVCYEDPIAQRVIQRITDITNIPEVNSENLQMLRYEVGEFYQVRLQETFPTCVLRHLSSYLLLPLFLLDFSGASRLHSSSKAETVRSSHFDCLHVPQ